MLQQFRTFDKDRADVYDLVALVAFGEMFREACDHLNLDEPEFVDIQLKSLKRTIKARMADTNAARLKEVQSRLEALKTPSEKKSELLKEAKALEAQLQEAEL